MADSYSHKLGELIGDIFEESIINYLKPIVAEQGFYLDYRHSRPARNNSKEVIGEDSEGNKHKLDIVIEKNGSETQLGIPCAFIEMAWRRYTKHSKAKVQEIAGAIIPLTRTFHQQSPFYAAVLAGEFTQNSIEQLISQGFYVLHFSYEELSVIYNKFGISIRWEEDSSETFIKSIAHKIEHLSISKRKKLENLFCDTYKEKLSNLSKELSKSLSKTISQVIILPIHGSSTSVSTIKEAVKYITNYKEEGVVAPILRYEIIIRYSTGDEINMRCENKRTALQFLHQFV